MISSLGLDCKQFSKSRREQNSTSPDTKSTTRHRRRKETEQALKFIHGGESGSYHGAWDYIVANAPKELVGKFITGCKRGKYMQELYEKAMKEHQASPEALKQAISTKYQNFLSRRKFMLVCKTQTSYFNAESEVWVPRNVKCMGIDLRIPRPTSNAAVDKFVKELNIGTANQIPNAPGVTRTVTGLVFMIIDLHLRVPHLTKKLVWFNDLENHFIFQFSDDGAPETSQLTMSIGSLTMWNLGDRVRSSDFQYLLHCVSLGEKDEILENLWKQHTDEMALLEGNIITVCEKQCIVEFQPSADMCWQSWANNELNHLHMQMYTRDHSVAWGDQLDARHLILGNRTAMRIDQSMQRWLPNLWQPSQALFQKRLGMKRSWDTWQKMASDSLGLLALDSLLTDKDLNHSIVR